ncbi:MAG: acyltransferase family protein [Candidatus Baltobacteraceae bacterium]
MAGNRLGVLDGLRGIAVLLVVWFHIWQISWLPAPLPLLQFIPEGGFIGVDIFFFISGFVICYPFVQSVLEGKRRPTWAHFAYRRAIKIVPSYVLSIVLMYVIGYTVTQGGSGHTWFDLTTHLLFIHNWFGSTYGSINGVLWTLAVEVQFYILFPLIWCVFMRWPVVTAAGMCAVAMIYRIDISHNIFTDQLIEQLPAYLDLFGCGMLAAWLYVFLRNRPAMETTAARAAATALAVCGFVILIALMENLFGIRSNVNGFTTWKVIHRTWLAFDCLAIATGSLFAFPLWKKLLGNPALVFCSFISYNWYIYHQVVARELWWHHVPVWKGTDPHSDPHWQLMFSLLAFPAGLLVAALATYAFERPVMNKRWLDV